MDYKNRHSSLICCACSLLYEFYFAMMASISSTVLGKAADKSSQPVSVMTTSFSMRIPMDSSST